MIEAAEALVRSVTGGVFGQKLDAVTVNSIARKIVRALNQREPTHD